MSALFIGIFFFALGNVLATVFMIASAFVLEKNLYRCPNCDHKLNKKVPLTAYPHCPACGWKLRKS